IGGCVTGHEAVAPPAGGTRMTIARMVPTRYRSTVTSATTSLTLWTTRRRNHSDMKKARTTGPASGPWSATLMLTFNTSRAIPVDVQHEGVDEQAGESGCDAGDPRCHGVEDARHARPHARLWDRATDRAGVERPAASQSGHDLSGTRASSAAWMDYLALGRERQQAARKILRAHESGA